MDLQEDEFGTMRHNPDTQSVELIWSDGTASMTDDQFKAALEQFADYAMRLGTPHLLVDLRRFAHRPGPDLGGWRAETIVPRYQQAGVTKFAYIVPEGAPASPPAELQGEPFLTGYFQSVEDAEEWIRSP